MLAYPVWRCLLQGKASSSSEEGKRSRGWEWDGSHYPLASGCMVVPSEAQVHEGADPSLRAGKQGTSFPTPASLILGAGGTLSVQPTAPQFGCPAWLGPAFQHRASFLPALLFPFALRRHSG